MTSVTRFWLVRHALVEENARAVLYGQMDVPLCPHSLSRQGPSYRALASRLPRDAVWLVTPLQRTARTAAAIQAAGCGHGPAALEPGLTEQDLGAWQGLRHADLPSCLTGPAHPFWPLGASEIPPGGESMDQVLLRVASTIEKLAAEHQGRDIVAISHGGAIRAAVAHALGMGAQAALHLSIQNLSLTIIERHAHAWRVVTVNETVAC